MLSNKSMLAMKTDTCKFKSLTLSKLPLGKSQKQHHFKMFGRHSSTKGCKYLATKRKQMFYCSTGGQAGIQFYKQLRGKMSKSLSFPSSVALSL